jgi:hypothetical protein
MLSVEVWKELSHRLTAHESRGQQFSENVGRPVYAERTPFQCHGIQSGMPKFGAPAGYGIGQHDPPRSLQDMWNFYEHIRRGIEELIATTYGKGAYDLLNRMRPSQPLSPTSRLDKAILLRETVRSYNGCHEFVYENDQWIMRPWGMSKGKRVPIPPKRLPYADNALGTHVKYQTPPRHEDRVAEDNLRNIAGTMESLL